MNNRLYQIISDCQSIRGSWKSRYLQEYVQQLPKQWEKYQSWAVGSERNAILYQPLEPKTTDVLLHSSVKSSLSLPKLKS